MRLIAGPTQAGQRLDAWLATVLEVSRARAVDLLASGAFRYNVGGAVKPSRRIRSGDVLEGEVPDLVTAGPAAETGTVPVLFEDPHLLVVNKPAGVTVHPGAGRPGGTLVNILLGMRVKLSTVGGRLRPGIVHRLDRDTSGVLVVAKTDAAFWKLVKMIEAREIKREYLAVVLGVPVLHEGTIDANLGRDLDHRERFTVVEGGGRRAITHYAVDRAFGTKAARLKVTLETGRTHQIRVHLAAIGHPILGDIAYGGSKVRNPGIDRQALHAARLSFRHPMTGKPVSVKAPLPPDMAALLRRFEG